MPHMHLGTFLSCTSPLTLLKDSVPAPFLPARHSKLAGPYRIPSGVTSLLYSLTAFHLTLLYSDMQLLPPTVCHIPRVEGQAIEHRLYRGPGVNGTSGQVDNIRWTANLLCCSPSLYSCPSTSRSNDR